MQRKLFCSKITIDYKPILYAEKRRERLTGAGRAELFFGEYLRGSIIAVDMVRLTDIYDAFQTVPSLLVHPRGPQ